MPAVMSIVGVLYRVPLSVDYDDAAGVDLPPLTPGVGDHGHRKIFPRVSRRWPDGDRATPDICDVGDISMGLS